MQFFFGIGVPKRKFHHPNLTYFLAFYKPTEPAPGAAASAAQRAPGPPASLAPAASQLRDWPRPRRRRDGQRRRRQEGQRAGERERVPSQSQGRFPEKMGDPFSEYSPVGSF